MRKYVKPEDAFTHSLIHSFTRAAIIGALVQMPLPEIAGTFVHLD